MPPAAIEAADKALEAGDLQGAAEVYAAVLQQDAQNVAALAGLARCYLKSGDTARAEQTLGAGAARQAGRRPGRQRARRPRPRQASPPRPATRPSCEAKVAAEPANHQARIDYAMALAAGGKKAEALDQLLEAVRRDRKWNEEAARKQLVQLFEAWGPKDPATLDGRRRLSSILFS